jgi:predicted site-specific integrase-resolvase
MPSQAHIPTYIPLEQAARHYGLSKKVLTQEIRAGKIQAVQLPSGDLLVAAENNGQNYQTKEEIIAHKFAHLRKQTINAYQAQQKYDIPHQNFINWARAGHIEIVDEKERLLELNEADVAYCAYVYRQKKESYGGKTSGVRIFDKDGNPYQVKYPDLAAQRRK